MPIPKFTIPFNIPATITLIAEQIQSDGSIIYLVREFCQDKTLKGTKALFDLFRQEEVQPGDTFEIMKVATEDQDGFHSRIIVTKLHGVQP